MRAALLLIATGDRYRPYVKPLVESAAKYFIKHDALLWSDAPTNAKVTYNFQKKAFGFPNETLYRYHTILGQRSLLKQYSHLYYCDVDMLWVAPVNDDEITCGGILSVLHPGYFGEVGTPERRPESVFAIPFDAKNKYYCGGFNGGSTDAFLDMAEELAYGIDIDSRKGITPIWNDESAMNWYLYHNPPAKVLSPAFCYPDVKDSYYVDKWAAKGLTVTPKLLALTKDRG